MVDIRPMFRGQLAHDIYARCKQNIGGWQMVHIQEGRRETQFSFALRQALHLREAVESHFADVIAARQLMEETAELVRSFEPKPTDPPATVERVAPGDSSPITCDLVSVFVGTVELELAELAEQLLTAYEDAECCCDDARILPLRAALFQIGRLIATRLGPKAAGVRLN